jgi:hypothetical protein
MKRIGSRIYMPNEIREENECDTIASEYDITLATLYSWNSAIGSSCQYLDLGDYVCVKNKFTNISNS